jgi:hypothetical protein
MAFRPSLNHEQLTLTAEALYYYAKKLEAEANGHDFTKLRATSELCANFKRLLNGERKTGRRSKFHLGFDKL